MQGDADNMLMQKPCTVTGNAEYSAPCADCLMRTARHRLNSHAQRADRHRRVLMPQPHLSAAARNTYSLPASAEQCHRSTAFLRRVNAAGLTPPALTSTRRWPPGRWAPSPP